MRKRELERILRDLESQGAEVASTRKGWRILPPDGSGPIYTHRTPSDHRAGKNLRADIERAGLIWPEGKR